MLMNCVEEEVLKPITMLEPNIADAPLTRRSGAMAPLKANSALLPAVPLWNGTGVAGVGLISYQRTCAPGPPNTVCWVQIATLVPEPRDGSMADTALVRRVSEESSLLVLPFCTAFAGVEKAVTDTVLAA